jgi:membrane associated rhomboid family serine protease
VLLLIPYKADVPMMRWPIANIAILAAMAVVFALEYGMSEQTLQAGKLDAWSPNAWSLSRLLGHMWLHIGPVHLIGNMIFLWTFGNAVCAKIGNLTYPLVYVALGLFAGIIHMGFDSRPAMGASGAINGIVGLYLVLYPLNSISCFWLVFVRAGRFSLSGFWMILLWLAFDIWGATRGGGMVAYWAHLGGFAAGFGTGFLLLALGWVRMDSAEKSLLQVFRIQGLADRPPRIDPPRPVPAPVPSAGPVKPVLLNCTCGRTLKVPGRFVGKTVKCPECSQPLAVRAR